MDLVHNQTAYFEQLLLVLLLRLWVHSDGLVDGICNLLAVPWVDDKRAVQALSGTGELRKDHHPVSLLLAGDVLVGHLKNTSISACLCRPTDASYQVHAVPRTCYQADVAHSIESDQFGEGQTLVHEMNWHEFHGTEAAIDPPDELIDGGTKVLVLLYITTRRNSKLDEDDLNWREVSLLNVGPAEPITFPTHSGCCDRKTSRACSFCGTPLM